METKRQTLESWKTVELYLLSLGALKVQKLSQPDFMQPFLSPCPRQGGNITGFGRKADEGSRLITSLVDILIILASSEKKHCFSGLRNWGLRLRFRKKNCQK